MQVITSLILRKALKRPGIAPQSPPKITPARKAAIHAINTGQSVLPSTSPTVNVPIVPMRYCPAAPMLNSPVLKATATESPVIIKGVALKSMFPMFTGLKPKERAPPERPVLNIPKNTSLTPSQMPLVEILSLVSPTITMRIVPTAIPIIMEIMADKTDLAPSVRYHFSFPVSGPSLSITLPPFPYALHRTYKVQAPERLSS